MNTELVALGKEIKELTELNLVAESYIEIANFLGETELAEKFQHLLTSQLRHGYLTEEDRNTRFKLYQKLMIVGREQYGEDFDTHVYRNLYGEIL